MSRRYRRSRRRSSDVETLLVAALLLLGTIKAYQALFISLCYAAILVVATGLLVYSYRVWSKARVRDHLAVLTDVDVMDGLEFEAYVADLLRRHGYQHVSLTEPSDYGVDIIAERNGERWGIQAKRYTGRVGDFAVKQVVAALKVYHCSKAMVVTNSTYTSRAIKIGKSNGCVLIDRVELARLISDVTSKSIRRHATGMSLGELSADRQFHFG
jgi:HJR/Mrr/RecB family endonuclease